MFINPESLIEQTIHNLELISELLGAETNQRVVGTVRNLTPQLKSAADELRAARIPEAAEGLPPQRVCFNCDD